MKINGYEIEPFANLSGAYLSGADPRGAYLYGADLTGADLSKADLIGAYLRGAYLYKADLTGANLKWANLKGADLKGANLRGAYLYWANLRGADLTGADLSKADLGGADLTDTNLSQTCLSGYPGVTPAALEYHGWEVRDGYVYGVRTKTSQHVGSTTYEVGKTYTAPYLSTCRHTDCHPGIYVCRDEEQLHGLNLGYDAVPHVQVRAKTTDVIICRKGLRCKQIEVLLDM